jgi:hypothetical protein
VLLGIAALLPESAALATDSKTVLATLPPVAVIVIALVLLSAKQKPAGGPRRSMIIASCAMVLVMLGVTLFTLSKAPRGKVAAARNFYGALTVEHQHQGDPALDAYALEHGEVLHGFEFTAPDQRLVPTSYYAEKSGLGLTFANWDRGPSSLPRPSRSLRIGVIGLGIGTTTAYGRTGDYIRFYEINPAVVQLASDTRYFHYLQACPASFDIALGDARLSLERELAQGAPQNFDVLVVDAFSGDAIPVHLLTEQAFRLYFEHLKGPTGVLAVHVSNSLLNLRPVVAAAAHKLQVANVWVHVDGDEKVYKTSDWVLLCRDRGILDSIAAKSKHASELHVPDNRLWTDDYSNLFQALELHP